MNILIIGGAGFIGSSLSDRLLLDGYSVFVVDNFNNYYDVKLKLQKYIRMFLTIDISYMLLILKIKIVYEIYLKEMLLIALFI